MRYVMILALVSMLFFSCGKAGDVVPNVPVNLRITKGDPNFTALNSIGGYKELSNVGVAGIVIYHSNFGYVAFDRCSTYMPEKQCAIKVDETGLTMTDPCSGSKFSLSDGGSVKGPATRSLKPYQVSETQFEINVYN
jgi:nitrite reductase/ring-hydroxylating ferredoxin subunit